MPRGDHSIANEPFRTWVATVDEKNRVRLPKDVAGTVPWLEKINGSIDCLAMPGAVGGLQIAPALERGEEVRRLAKGVGASPASAGEAGTRWVDAARLLATAWSVAVHVEPGRVSLTLPESARRSGLVPDAGGVVVVFAFGEILEIWRAEQWHEHIRALARRRTSAVSQALDDLAER